MIPTQTLTDVDYTDDMALLANTPALAKYLLPSLEWVAGGIGHYVNADKTVHVLLIKEVISPH